MTNSTLWFHKDRHVLSLWGSLSNWSLLLCPSVFTPLTLRWQRQIVSSKPEMYQNSFATGSTPDLGYLKEYYCHFHRRYSEMLQILPLNSILWNSSKFTHKCDTLKQFKVNLRVWYFEIVQSLPTNVILWNVSEFTSECDTLKQFKVNLREWYFEMVQSLPLNVILWSSSKLTLECETLKWFKVNLWVGYYETVQS